MTVFSGDDKRHFDNPVYEYRTVIKTDREVGNGRGPLPRNIIQSESEVRTPFKQMSLILGKFSLTLGALGLDTGTNESAVSTVLVNVHRFVCFRFPKTTWTRKKGGMSFLFGLRMMSIWIPVLTPTPLEEVSYPSTPKVLGFQ